MAGVNLPELPETSRTGTPVFPELPAPPLGGGENGKGWAGQKGLTAGTLDEEDIARFIDRRARLLRWGWPKPEAEAQAERLVLRDRSGDDRVSCTDCSHYRPGRCGNNHAAGLNSPEIGRDLAVMLQRCHGHKAATAPEGGSQCAGI